MALTDTAIRAAKPGKRPYKIYDRDGLFFGEHEKSGNGAGVIYRVHSP